ncbi:hypothetical protein Pla163_22340 [Planctomycetes bacterium Pla163]|uniref:PepSY domain-containing protein n=1 Tax=Rohdeia mirabilis TaxID=2528008 RepID=A0A518D0Y4_9BACT|nr:hypothetical protein Pla163_22340 [Planctomycetes bacterium Pla163]
MLLPILRLVPSPARTADAWVRLVGLLAAGALTASCAGVARPNSPGLGRVPIQIVELYDLAAPDGVMELEIDRDGNLREIEADVSVLELPAVVADAALRHLPAGRVVGAERELTSKGPAWEVKFDVEGRGWEVVVDEQGRIIETEQSLSLREAPAVVLASAERAIPDALLLSVELIRRGDESEYHVKRERLGVSYKIVVAPDGRVLRRVREARAEIEIPLRD